MPSIHNGAMLDNPVPDRMARAALGGLAALAIAMGIGRFAFTPLLPLMIQGGQIDVAAGGWIAAANYAGYLAGALTATRLRWSALRLSAVALALTVALTTAMALSLPPGRTTGSTFGRSSPNTVILKKALPASTPTMPKSVPSETSA